MLTNSCRLRGIRTTLASYQTLTGFGTKEFKQLSQWLAKQRTICCEIIWKKRWRSSKRTSDTRAMPTWVMLSRYVAIYLPLYHLKICHFICRYLWNSSRNIRFISLCHQLFASNSLISDPKASLKIHQYLSGIFKTIFLALNYSFVSFIS